MYFQKKYKSIIPISFLLFFFLSINTIVYGQYPLIGPLDLLPSGQETHTVQNSGNWSDANTWGGSVPSNLAKILIPSGKTLTVDGEIATRIKIIRIDGKLDFLTTVNTGLKVETIVQGMMGELEIGTANNPVPSDKTCKITIIDEGNISLSSDQWEKGMVLMGKTTVYGASKTSWVTLSSNPSSGATTLNLATAPNGWEVGDRIVITGTDVQDAASDEVATIQSISGTTVTLTQALTKNHASPAADLFVHVANLSRNVVFETENATNSMDRGHIMFMHTLDVDFNNVRIHQFGRSRKDVPIDDWFIDDNDVFQNGARTNVRGRYSVHFHRGGVNQSLSPAYVRGCVVEDDPGWAYANHSAYVHFDNNVSYNVIGGAFQTEAGDELGSFTNNIAIRTVNPAYPIRLAFPDNAPDTREDSQDFAFQGDGFWVHGGGVTVSNNVASGCSGHAFIYWPEGLVEPGFPTGTNNNTFDPVNLGLSPNISNDNRLATGWYPITGFTGNIAYSSSVGFASYYLHTTFFYDEGDYTSSYLSTVHSTFENFTGWNIDQDGIQLHFTERVTFKNIRLVNADNDGTSRGIWASHFRAKNKQIFQDIHIEGFGTGFALPSQGQVTVDCGYLKNGVNLYVPSVQMDYRDMYINGLTTVVDQSFSNATDIKMEALLTPPTDKFPAYFLMPDKIILNYENFNNQRLFFNESAANYTPIPSDNEPYTKFDGERFILAEFATKSNQQLQSDYQMSFGGTIMPSNAVTSSNISGGKISPWQSVTLNVPVCLDTWEEFDIDAANQCIGNASNKVQGTMPNYTHPSIQCIVSDTEVELIENAIAAQVYPNPTYNTFNIKTEMTDYSVLVTSLDGRLVQQLINLNGQTTVDASNWYSGVYFIRVIDNDSQQSKVLKLVKVN